MDVFILEKYNGIWEKINSGIEHEFDTAPNFNKKFIKTKIRCYVEEATDFHVKKIPKPGYDYACLAVIAIDSVLK